ncbi:MAG: hypothetical protein WCG78_06610 [Candidatus Omnitrophota bacterium]
MIRLELSFAVALYLIFTVIGLFTLWAFFERKETLKEVNPEEKFVWQCSICTYFYVDSQHDDISACPRCGSYTKRQDERR